MKTIFGSALIVAMLHLPGMLLAQTDQEEINRQVWHPFMKCYEKLDAAQFMSLHSRELLRVELDENRMMGYEGYTDYYQDFFGRFRKTGEKIRIRFSFTHRISDGKKAYEKGYYEFTLHSAKGNVKAYGAFSVVLKKEQGQWKIIMDSDTNKDMNEALFMTGKILH
jgi:ketosteroid isomerase-like protein